MVEDVGERRSAPRSRALIAATVIYDQGLSTAPCMIRDKSPKGVLLRLDADVPLSADFDILFAGSSQKQRAELRWRRGNAVGVAFVTAAAAEAAENVFELGVQIDDLRLENAALRKQHASIARRLAALGYVVADEF